MTKMPPKQPMATLSAPAVASRWLEMSVKGLPVKLGLLKVSKIKMFTRNIRMAISGQRLIKLIGKGLKMTHKDNKIAKNGHKMAKTDFKWASNGSENGINRRITWSWPIVAVALELQTNFKAAGWPSWKKREEKRIEKISSTLRPSSLILPKSKWKFSNSIFSIAWKPHHLHQNKF